MNHITILRAALEKIAEPAEENHIDYKWACGAMEKIARAALTATEGAETSQVDAQPVAWDDDIEAAEKYADVYDGDDRQDIRADVQNAFWAGMGYARKTATQAPAVDAAMVRDAALEDAAEIADGWDTGAPDGCFIAEAIRAMKTTEGAAK